VALFLCENTARWCGFVGSAHGSFSREACGAAPTSSSQQPPSRPVQAADETAASERGRTCGGIRSGSGVPAAVTLRRQSRNQSLGLGGREPCVADAGSVPDLVAPAPGAPLRPSSSAADLSGGPAAGRRPTSDPAAADALINHDGFDDLAKPAASVGDGQGEGNLLPRSSDRLKGQLGQQPADRAPGRPADCASIWGSEVAGRHWSSVAVRPARRIVRALRVGPRLSAAAVADATTRWPVQAARENGPRSPSGGDAGSARGSGLRAALFLGSLDAGCWRLPTTESLRVCGCAVSGHPSGRFLRDRTDREPFCQTQHENDWGWRAAAKLRSPSSRSSAGNRRSLPLVAFPAAIRADRRNETLRGTALAAVVDGPPVPELYEATNEPGSHPTGVAELSVTRRKRGLRAAGPPAPIAGSPARISRKTPSWLTRAQRPRSAKAGEAGAAQAPGARRPPRRWCRLPPYPYLEADPRNDGDFGLLIVQPQRPIEFLQETDEPALWTLQRAGP